MGVICKTGIGTLANSADPDQKMQNMASDQGLHCFLKLRKLRFKQNSLGSLIQDYFPSLHSETIDPTVLSVL